MRRFTLLPSYPDLPMEQVYPRVPRTDVPGVYAREEGRGRVVYFPFDIDRTFWEVLSPDHGLAVQQRCRWARNEEQPLVGGGQRVLDVSLWMQKSSIAAHLVNLTNPMMMKGRCARSCRRRRSRSASACRTASASARLVCW